MYDILQKICFAICFWYAAVRNETNLLYSPLKIYLECGWSANLQLASACNKSCTAKLFSRKRDWKLSSECVFQSCINTESSKNRCNRPLLYTQLLQKQWDLRDVNINLCQLWYESRNALLSMHHSRLLRQTARSDSWSIMNPFFSWLRVHAYTGRKQHSWIQLCHSSELFGRSFQITQLTVQVMEPWLKFARRSLRLSLHHSCLDWSMSPFTI